MFSNAQWHFLLHNWLCIIDLLFNVDFSSLPCILHLVIKCPHHMYFRILNFSQAMHHTGITIVSLCLSWYKEFISLFLSWLESYLTRPLSPIPYKRGSQKSFYWHNAPWLLYHRLQGGGFGVWMDLLSQDLECGRPTDLSTIDLLTLTVLTAVQRVLMAWSMCI